ncbi:MAG: hypothetical protein WBQ23_04255 [Bacteroidota bacterium]
MKKDRTMLLIGLILPSIFILSAGCETSHNPEHPTHQRTLYSLEDALDNPEYAVTLFLDNIGDSLSPEIGNLPVLSNVYISNSEIAYLPDEFANRRFLLACWIRNCRFQHIPPQLLNLDILTTLNLDRNEIEEIPTGFGRQVALRYLSLCNNKISKIERSALNLKNCESIRLDSNRLVDFNFNMSDFPQLQELTLTGNLLSDSEKSKLRLEFAGLEVLRL